MISETPAAAPPNSITPENYAFLQEHLYRSSGMVLEAGKGYLLEARLTPIVARKQLGSLNNLCALLRSNGNAALHHEVVDAMTINETLFFRDAPMWQALKATLLPEIVESRRAVKRLRFWSAASSSGQEAYSLAMTLMEMGLGSWDIQIVGTDISSRMVERSRAGRFSQLEVNRGVPAMFFVKYFTRNGLDWQVKDEIKAKVRFEQLDLRQSLRSFGPFDMVFCRNVLIYFDRPTKQSVLKEIRGTMFGGAYLVLGSAETTFNLDDFFERRPVGQATFYRLT